MTGDLFGFVPVQDSGSGEVSLRMVLHHQTQLAWLLGPTTDRRAAKWIPKSKCKRGEGRDENVWSMARAEASERGWL
ncbi:hypothetical protein [Brevundimonas sp.]|uniref:hypothetical protein n=1 Tax=Brevundimonas sp. TaxID=1871086 RepID=UPI00289DEAEE|nr:hypothetical protein [Brevundimonas sp.]